MAMALSVMGVFVPVGDGCVCFSLSHGTVSDGCVCFSLSHGHGTVSDVCVFVPVPWPWHCQ